MVTNKKHKVDPIIHEPHNLMAMDPRYGPQFVFKDKVKERKTDQPPMT